MTSVTSTIFNQGLVNVPSWGLVSHHLQVSVGDPQDLDDVKHWDIYPGLNPPVMAGPVAQWQVEDARQKIKQLMHEQERAADYEDRLARRRSQNAVQNGRRTAT